MTKMTKLFLAILTIESQYKKKVFMVIHAFVNKFVVLIFRMN